MCLRARSGAVGQGAGWGAIRGECCSCQSYVSPKPGDWTGWVGFIAGTLKCHCNIWTVAEAFKCREVKLIQVTEKQGSGWWWGANHRVESEDSIVRKEERGTDCVCLQINSVCSDLMSKRKGMVDNGFSVPSEILVGRMSGSQCVCEVRCGETVVTPD